MLPDLSVSDADLAGLEEELGGCDFGSAECRSFLESRNSRDVQAAPGSGKTTLLVAKLLLLVRRWTEPTRGICVVSHTNVARREVERRVTAVEAAQLLGHPHFIGTVTTFIHRFVALPFLRGLGWPVSAIDDEVFAHRAHRAMHRNAFLRKQLHLQHNQRRFPQWARALSVSDSFCPGIEIPDRVPIRDISGMPGGHTDTRKAFEAIKAEVLSQGIYRYDDMVLLARRGLAACPAWRDALASRFPLVLVDEAQDTGGLHLELIDEIFGGKARVQRIGDCNQTIYDDEAEEAQWQPLDDALDLGASHRFGRSIAAFASKMTVRRGQIITGRGPEGALPTVITYPANGAELVMQKFAELVADACVDEAPIAWAIASVHRPSASASGLTLCNYHPPYRAPGSRSRNEIAHAAFRDAALLARRGGCLAEPLAMAARAVLELLRRQGVPGFENRIPHRGLWQRLDDAAPNTSQGLKALLRDCLTGRAGLDVGQWDATCSALVAALDSVFDKTKLNAAARDFLAEAEDEAPPTHGEANCLDVAVGERTVHIKLGSIASVKGETHDATLVVQTKLNSTSDVKTALSIAAGIQARPTSATPLLLRAATNVFVGATRPRHLLCLAMPADDLKGKLLAAVTGWGWRIAPA